MNDIVVQEMGPGGVFSSLLLGWLVAGLQQSTFIGFVTQRHSREQGGIDSPDTPATKIRLS